MDPRLTAAMLAAGTLLGRRRFDASETANFKTALEFIMKGLVDTDYAKMKARELIPFVTEAPPGTQTLVFEGFSEIGEAKIVANYADDLPGVDFIGAENRRPVRIVADAYQFSTFDLQRALRGVNFQQKRAAVARNRIAAKLERIAAIGDAEYGLYGLYNQPGVSIGSATGTWGAATSSDDMLTDLNKGANTAAVASLDNYAPDTMVLPIAKYQLAANKKIGVDSNMTVLKFFLETNPYIKQIGIWNYGATAGASSNPRMVTYKKDPTIISMQMIQEYTEMAPQPRNLAMIVPAYAQTAGVICTRPTSMYYVDGI